MKDVRAMGKIRDRGTRVRWARQDDEIRKKRVSDARTYLYKDHLSFASNFVEARMDDGSLVPTDVRSFHYDQIARANDTDTLPNLLECVLSTIVAAWL